MKRIVHYGLFLVTGIALFFACKEDEFSELDATREQITFEDSIQAVRDSLEAVGGIIDYSINLVAASGSGFIDGRPEGDPSLAGVTVTISQHGTTQTVVTDETGIAAFADLRIGTVSISVDDTAYTNVDALVYLNVEPDSAAILLTGVERQAATMIPLFSTTEQLAFISGKVTFESDLTDSLPEDAGGITVVGSIDFDDPDFRDDYFADAEFYGTSGCTDCKEIAKIVNMAYIDAALSTTTAADGTYTLAVPSTTHGLPIKVEISEFAADQTLLIDEFHGDVINDVRTVRTVFSSEFTSTSDISDIPSVPRALAFIDAPTGTAGNPPDDQAFADANLAPSGLASITIVDQGFGYTQPPELIIDDPADPLGVPAEAEAFLTNGRVTSIVLTESGSGYDLGTTVNVTPVNNLDDEATADPFITFSITDFTLNTTGTGYTSEPSVTIESGEGSGASARAILDGIVTDVTLTDIGSGYVAPPEVAFVGVANDEAEATVTLTQYNPLHSILLSDDYDGTFETAPTVRIVQTGTGSGARAVATLNTSNGFVGRIALTNVGAGYQQAPAVLISGGGGQGAAADAEINGAGEVVAINILDGGSGYTSTPTITISSPVSGGTQATADIFLWYEIDEITLINPGSGYDVAYNAGAADLYNNEPDVELYDASGNLLDDFNGGGSLALGSETDIVVRPNASIASLTITDNGDGYEAVPTVVFNPIFGQGSGAAATAEVLFDISELELITGGSGYELSSHIDVIVGCDDCDTRAEFSANLGEGTLSSIELTNGGEGYIFPPNVILEHTSTTVEDVEIEATISNGEVTGFNIISGGDDLVSFGTYTIDIEIFISSVSLDADVIQSAGQLSHITITDPGSGYETEPLVEFVNDGTGGSGASATAVLENGRVVNIILDNPGSGYVSEPDVNLIIPTFTETAEASLTINSEGYVTGISIDDGGEGYVVVPNITIVPILPGRGSGAAASVTYIDNGEVDDAFITNQGSGYTGRNIPTSKQTVEIFGDGNLFIDAFTDKTYVRDIYLGTGRRTSDLFE